MSVGACGVICSSAQRLYMCRAYTLLYAMKCLQCILWFSHHYTGLNVQNY